MNIADTVDHAGHEASGDATIHAVALHAGVAVSTVSTFIHHPDRVGVDTAERIGRAMKELRYRPNPYAQALRTGRLNVHVVVSLQPHPTVVGVFHDRSDAATAAETEHSCIITTTTVL